MKLDSYMPSIPLSPATSSGKSSQQAQQTSAYIEGEVVRSSIPKQQTLNATSNTRDKPSSDKSASDTLLNDDIGDDSDSTSPEQLVSNALPDDILLSIDDAHKHVTSLDTANISTGINPQPIEQPNPSLFESVQDHGFTRVGDSYPLRIEQALHSFSQIENFAFQPSSNLVERLDLYV